MDPAFREEYNALLADSGRQGCEYTFVNISLWGRQRMTRFQDWVVLFSQYGRCSVYPFPVGVGDPRAVLDAIFEDARLRGIPCRLTGLSQEDCALLENYCPGKFRFHPDRDSFDYVYKIEELAFLKGKRYQSKRNFCNRFWNANPHCQLVPITRELLLQVQSMLDRWYRDRLQEDPYQDFLLEQLALNRAFSRWDSLGLEGMALMDGEQVIAFSMASPLGKDTFDIHFEKALDVADGAYAAINQGFARHLMEKYPQVQWLNREDDMGIPGLRKAKLSYHPDHMVEKYWARLWEDEDEN
jgi:hypothetical protein